MSTQFVIVAQPFGYPMYASAFAAGWSDQKADAYVYDDRDNPELKVTYWQAQLATHGIDGASVQVEIA